LISFLDFYFHYSQSIVVAAFLPFAALIVAALDEGLIEDHFLHRRHHHQ